MVSLLTSTLTTKLGKHFRVLLASRVIINFESMMVTSSYRCKAMKSYQNYWLYLKRNKQAVKCPLCPSKMRAQTYPDHRKSKHDSHFDSKLQCAFCPDYRWPAGHKTKEGDHLLECLKKFLLSRHADVPVDDESTTSMEVDEEPLPPPLPPSCACVEFHTDAEHCWVGERRMTNVGGVYENFGRGDDDDSIDWYSIREPKSEILDAVHSREPQTIVEINPLLHYEDYEDIYDWGELCGDQDDPLLSDMIALHGVEEENTAAYPINSLSDLPLSSLLTILNSCDYDHSSGLEDAAKWIRIYARHSLNFDWIHLMIRFGAYQSFEETFLHKARHLVYALPYWCLCDGHPETKALDRPRYLWHRHMLLVVRNRKQFDKLFQSVKFEGEVLLKGEAKGIRKKIVGMHHFINAMYYLSSRKSSSSTPSSTYISRDDRRYHNLHHVHIARPMAPHARLWMVLLVPGLIDSYLARHTGRKNVGNPSKKIRWKGRWYGLASEMTGISKCRPRFRSNLVSIDGSSPQTVNQQLGDLLYDVETGVSSFGLFYLGELWYRVHENCSNPRTLMDLNQDESHNYFALSRNQQQTMNTVAKLKEKLTTVESTLEWSEQHRRELDESLKVALQEKDRVLQLLQEKDQALKEKDLAMERERLTFEEERKRLSTNQLRTSLTINLH